MVQTSVELVDGTGHSIVAIHEITVGEGSTGLFAPVTDVSNAVCTSPLLGVLDSRATAGLSVIG